MKVRWEYEGKQYVISGHRGGKMYLNKYLYDGCEEILEGLGSHDPHTRTIAKSKAKRVFKMLREYHSQEGYMQAKWRREYDERKRKEEQKEKEWREFKDNWPCWLIGIAFVIGIIYLIYQIWWFFIGDWAFNGPFADDISAGDMILESILFLIAFIVIIEEVVRRIMNGHF